MQTSLASSPAGASWRGAAASAGLLAVTGVRDLVMAIRAQRGPKPAATHGHISALPVGIGAVPCPISTLVMAFALGAGAPTAGVVTCLLFGAGLGTALFAIALVAWLLRRHLSTLLASRARIVVTLILPVAGALALVVFGVLTLPI